MTKSYFISNMKNRMVEDFNYTSAIIMRDIERNLIQKNSLIGEVSNSFYVLLLKEIKNHTSYPLFDRIYLREIKINFINTKLFNSYQ